MMRSSNLPSLDRDEPLELLADDRALAGPMTDACHAFAPLLAVEPRALAADDRAALATHLGGCARCRAVGLELWLDGLVSPPDAMVVATLPPARQLARAPSNRRRVLAASAMAAFLGGSVFAATRWIEPAPATSPVPPGSGSHAPEPAAGSSAPTTVRPWAAGVSPAEQEAALALFQQGNAHLHAGQPQEAARLYREALTHWDHPGISFNLAHALIGADQPVEQHRALVKAVRHGVAPLDPEKLERARTMLVEVGKVLTRVDFTTQLAGATLVIDGQDVFTGPGRFHDVVRAGRHTWTVRVGSRSSLVREVELVGGTTVTLPDVDAALRP